MADAAGFTILAENQWIDPEAALYIGMVWANRPATPAIFYYPQEGTGEEAPTNINEATENLRLANQNAKAANESVQAAIEDLERLQGS